MTVPFRHTSSSRFTIWLVGVSFVLFQFFLQLSSGVIINSIMQDMSLTALVAGLLSGSFYLIYTTLQIPVGILFDRKNTRYLLSLNALLCSIGCFVFANSTSLLGLFIGRLLIGAGSAFAFIGLSHLLRQYFPARQFAFMIGLSETLGFLAAAIGMFCMSQWISQCGWRAFIEYAGWVGIIITGLCWAKIPDSREHPIAPLDKKQFLTILRNYQIWLNALFVGLSFSVVTVFGALWSVPYIQMKLNCTTKESTIISALFFIGAGFSCPLFGVLSHSVKHRRQLILASCLTTASLFLALLYLPNASTLSVSALTFLIGLCCGAYMLSYTISNELAPHQLQSTATGFTNTLAVLSALILQPFVGYLMDMMNPTSIYTINDYQRALLVIPVCLMLASCLVVFLPE